MRGLAGLWWVFYRIAPPRSVEEGLWVSPGRERASWRATFLRSLGVLQSCWLEDRFDGVGVWFHCFLGRLGGSGWFLHGCDDLFSCEKP